MESRILRRMFVVLIGILFGFPIGCLVTLGIMGLVQQSTAYPEVMKFGDFTICAIKHNDANDHFAADLMISKDGRPFLWAEKNKSGEVTNLSLADGAEHVILTLKTSHLPGKWIFSRYGSPDLIGESYVDIDFNGRFDIKAITDSNGKVLSRYIYFQGFWKKIDHFQKQKAFVGSDTFTFYSNLGWQLDETDKVEDPKLE